MITTPDITWIAAGAGQASEPTNWSLGRAPQTGDRVKWTDVSSNNCSWDLDALSVTADGWVIEVGYGGTVAQSTVDIGLGPSGCTHQAGVFTGNPAKTVTSSGNMVANTGATISPYSLNLKMTGDGTSISGSYSIAMFRIRASANMTYSRASGGARNLVVDPGKTLTISNGNSLVWYQYYDTGNTFANSGSVVSQGTGKLWFIHNADVTYPALGDLNCNLFIDHNNAGSGNATATLGGNTVIGGYLTIQSSHPSYTMALAHGSNCSLTVAGLTTLGVRAIMNQGTAQWSFNGGYTQSGASSAFNQGGPVSVLGDTVISDGTLTGANDITKPWTSDGNFTRSGGSIASMALSLVMIGNGRTLALPGETTFKKLTILGVVSATLSSGYSYANRLDVQGSLNLVNSGLTLLVRYDTSGTFSNTGKIIGAGKLLIECFVNKSIAFGNILCPLSLDLNGAAASATISMISTESVGLITVKSNHASNTLTLDTAGFALSHRGLTVGVRGAIKLNASKVLSYGNTDTSAGSADFGTSQYVQAGPGTIKLAAGQSMNDVEAPVVGLNLASDVTINGKYRHLRAATLNGFTLTYDPSKEIKMFEEGRNMAMRQARMAAIGGAL